MEKVTDYHIPGQVLLIRPYQQDLNSIENLPFVFGLDRIPLFRRRQRLLDLDLYADPEDINSDTIILNQIL